MSHIHPTAIISPEANIADDVRIGPYSILEGPITLGPGCVLQANVHIQGPVTLGSRNVIHTGAVVGGWPQDRKFNGAFSEVVIGDDNIIREGVTIHRGTGANTRTLIGSRCYLMVNSHVGHNCVVSDDVTLVNGALLAGHVHVGPRAIVGGNTALHQFVRVGRLAMVSNGSCHNVDIPPFFIAMVTNHITQLNVVGLRRAGIPSENISALRQLLRILRGARMTRSALENVPASLQAVPEVREWLDFCRSSVRGVAVFQAWSERSTISASEDEEAE